MKILLDTSAYSAMRRGNPAVADRVRNAEGVVFSIVVAGELLHGFHHGRRLTLNLRELESFLDEPRVSLLPVSWATADRFGRIAALLRRKGTPIPSNDIWIAAHAMETGAELISFDDHFDAVDGLLWSRPDSR